MRYFWRSFVKSDQGATAVEYALLLALVGVAIGIAVSVIGVFVSDTLVFWADELGAELRHP